MPWSSGRKQEKVRHNSRKGQCQNAHICNRPGSRTNTVIPWTAPKGS